MDFKIKFRIGAKMIFVLFALIMVAGGFAIGAAAESINSMHGEKTPPRTAFVGIFLVVIAFVAILSLFSDLSRTVCDIDIDSFTEAEINEKIEERWGKIKEQVNSQK